LAEHETATTVDAQLANVQVLEPKFYDFDYETAPQVAVASTAPVKKAASLAAVDMLDASRPQWALVLGSFADYSGAAELARKVKPEPGLITTFVDHGEIRYRVSTSPLKRDQAAGRDLNIAALNLETIRLMPVCPVWTQKTGNCIALDRRVVAQQVTQR
jgi:hypothetical protein